MCLIKMKELRKFTFLLSFTWFQYKPHLGNTRSMYNDSVVPTL